jgi:hypothetical protein
MDCSSEALRECGLVVKADGRIVRATAAELMPLLCAKIGRLADLVRAYERKIAETRGELGRLKEEAGRRYQDKGRGYGGC